MPDIGGEIAMIENQNLEIEKEAELKEELFKDFTIKSERIHTMSQLLKATCHYLLEPLDSSH